MKELKTEQVTIHVFVLLRYVSNKVNVHMLMPLVYTSNKLTLAFNMLKNLNPSAFLQVLD